MPSWQTSYGPLPSQSVEWTKPNGFGRTVVVVALHGGYWRARYGLDHLRPFCSALARRGFLVASVEYRRLGEAGGGWPGTLDDVEQGVASVLTEVARETRHTGVLLVGHSAGGQLALWSASRLKAPSEGLSLVGVIGLAPLSDLAEACRLNLSDGVVRELMGGGPEEVPERYRATSPIEVLPLGVPTIVVHGTLDEDVPFGLSPTYLQRARAAGDEARLVTLEGAGHFDVIEPDSRYFPQVLTAIESLV